MARDMTPLCDPAVVTTANAASGDEGLSVAAASRRVDDFDAVSVFRRISRNGQGFILEGRSREPGADRFVYVGTGDCERLLTGLGTAVGDVNPALALREKLGSRRISGRQVEVVKELAIPFLSGAVGYFGYESIRHFEPSVGGLPADPAGLLEAAFFLPGEFLVYDRAERVLTAVVHYKHEGSGGTAETAAHRLLEQAATGAHLEAPTRPQPYRGEQEFSLHDPEQRQRYMAMVSRARAEIERGELIQAVLSQRAVRRTNASPLDVYRTLSTLNPSPYMFMLNFGEFAVVGSSPELMVRSRGRRVSMHPIAGTRPRGGTAEQDASMEAELLTSEKERAEHVMLVDLARNDLGRVCEPGSVTVESFQAVERYSHVMHLVSRVRGRLRTETDGLDAFVAGFPLGTLTGAPRLRAVELIAELEGEGRGPYCGGVGWFDASGDVDTGTVIRCVVFRNGVAHIQGGGGVVFDSDPEREYLESVQKMAAQSEALERSERLAGDLLIAAGAGARPIGLQR